MEVIKLSKFKENDRVVVTDGEHQGKIGTVVSICQEEYLVKTDRCVLFDNIIHINESALRMAELADECTDDDFELELEGIRNHLDESGIILEADANLLDYVYYQEMAGQLPRDKTGKCNLIIAVGQNERSVPHFHVFRSEKDKEAWRNGACLFFTENCYFDHSNNKETLTRKELDMVVSKLKEVNKKRKITNWEYLVMLWNDNNPDYEIDDEIPMPEYDYRTIRRYEEHKSKRK